MTDPLPINEWAVGFVVPGWGEHDVLVFASSIDEAIDLGLAEAGLDKDEVTVAYAVSGIVRLHD